MSTSQRAVTLPIEHQGTKATGHEESPARGERADGTAEVPDRQLDIRDR
ncbi:MAG: hypothetical protein ACRDZ0_04455 [Acidimicrobiales bacterium]